MTDFLSIIASLVTIVAQGNVIVEQQEVEQPPIEVREIEINSRRDAIIQAAIERRERIISQTQL